MVSVKPYLVPSKPQGRTVPEVPGTAARWCVINRSRGRVLLPDVLLADTLWKRVRGLLGTRATGRGQSCWLTGCSSVHALGMRYALDLFFLDLDGRIIFKQIGLRPWRFSAWILRATQVLEVESGWLHTDQAPVGDILVIQSIDGNLP